MPVSVSQILTKYPGGRAQSKSVFGVDILTIELIDENKIKISLSHSDMERLDISYSELDYSNMDTRRIIWTLLCEAKNSLELELDLFSKMMVEVLPSSSDGCTILFTVLDSPSQTQQSKILIKKNCKPCVYEFSDLDSLIPAITGPLFHESLTADDCELYTIDGRYRLIITISGRRSLDLPDMFTEFGVYIGEGKSYAAYTREHGKLIADCENIKKLVEAFSL